MRTNVATKHEPILTAGGAQAVRTSVENSLRRSVLSCLLWEDAFYEDGVSITDRIVSLAGSVKPEVLAALAVEARHEQNLRHVSLLLVAVLASKNKGRLVADTIVNVISRADELTEFLAIYAKLKGVGTERLKKIMTHAMRRGLRRAFTKFDEYQLAKYNSGNAVKLRDVYFLVHPKPESPEQRALWERLIGNTMANPDTWEQAALAGEDKKSSFERLLSEGKLGYMALLKNLRQMEQVGVNQTLISEAIRARKGAQRVLPFRFLTAARHAPRFERALDEALIASLGEVEKLPGKTILVVDVSGSMGAALSRSVRGPSELNRLDTAAALAALITGVCENPVVYATAGSDIMVKHDTRLIPARQGMAMVDAIRNAARKQGGGGIFLTQCMDYVAREEKTADRIIVLTDEQDTDHKMRPDRANIFGTRNYMINVSVEKNGIGYKPKFIHIDGWSEKVIQYIAAVEKAQN